MSEGGAAKSAPDESVLRRIDDAVFAVEQAVVAAFLIAMTVMVFLDVLYRRLVAPDSKIGTLVARVFGIEDEGTRAFIDGTLAPWVGAALGIVLLWFAFWTAERHKTSRLLPMRQGPLVLAVLSAAGVAALSWLMLSVDSKWVYLILYALAALSYVAVQIRKRPPRWQLRAGAVLAVVTPFFVYSALTWFPRGYTWSKDMSLMLLLWVGFLGASVCAHEGKHLRMEAFEKLFTPALARWLRVAAFFATAAFSGLLALLGYLYLFAPADGFYFIGSVFSEQTQVPDWIAGLPVPLGFGIAAIRFAAAGVSSALGGTYGAPPVDESLEQAEKAKAEMEGAPVEEMEAEAKR